MVGHFASAAQNTIDENFEIFAALRHQPANGDAVQHPIRVIGHNNQRAGFGHMGGTAGMDMHIQVEPRNNLVPKSVRGQVFALIIEIKFFQKWLAAQAFHGANGQNTPQ